MTEKAIANGLKLRGKPKCLCCGNPLIYVYEGSVGYLGVKCKRCNQEFFVNTETLEVTRKPRQAS